MGKFRKRVKGSKGKRWRKGQSCTTNPESTKFRDAAKIFQNITGPSMLTEEAVKKHSAKAYNIDDGPIEEDIESFDGGQTFKTFASNWSGCSNQSFSRFLNNYSAGSAENKAALAVLAAVTDVIKEGGGSETSTEYFAALMTALESTANTEETDAAIISLLCMNIKSVPVSVLQAKFSQVSSKLIAVLTKYANSEKTALLRGLLGCLSILLRNQEPAVWENASTIEVLKVLLNFIVFSKPKVRKAAQHGITVIVRSSKITQGGLAHVAKHCINLVESSALDSVTTTLHVFTLLKDIMYTFPKKELKACCETVLKVMTMNNVLLLSCGFQVIHGMFLGKPKTLPPADGARLLNALYDYQPPPTDSQPTQAWLAALQQAYLFLAQADLSLCMANAPRLFAVCTGLFTSDRPELITAATLTMQAVISESFRPASRPEALPLFQQYIAKIILILKEMFSYEYHPGWTHVLHLISAVFQACGDTCANVITPCLKSLVQLRDSEQFTFINELENAIGVAIKTMGPEVILKIVPFQVDYKDKDKEFKRSWLLPILKDNIKGSSLKTFIEHFLPVAISCRTISDRLKNENETIRSIGYNLLEVQIWSLLPSFATEPNDIALSFPTIAKALGGLLNTRKDLRNIVFTALRKLIQHSISSDNQNDIAIMKKFAKNYLPILFSIYTTKVNGSDEEGTRLAAYETIKVYLQVAGPEVRKELFDKTYEKIENGNEFMKESTLDLLRILVLYQDKECIEMVFNKVVSKIRDCENHKEQKKYYRLIEEMCFSTQSEELNNFLNEKLYDIKELLTDTLSKAAPSSKSSRLKCILELLKRIDDPDSFVLQILPETILCLKDLNSKCRKIAYSVIEYVAKTFEPEHYLEIITTGMTGNQAMISCSLLAASAVIYHARDKISEEVEKSLLYCVELLASSSTREVVSSALGFIRVYIQVFPRDKVGIYMRDVIKIISKMNEDCKRHNRKKIRDILSRLCRWFGADEVTTYIPSDDEILRVRVKNLGKIENRKKKKDAASKASSASAPVSTFSISTKHKSIEEILAESDSDLDADEDDEADNKDKKGRGKVWIAEDGEDIVDFTDKSAARKITASKPGAFVSLMGKKNLKKKKEEFKTAPDGRMIIKDDWDSDEDDEGVVNKKKKKPILPGLDDSDDYDDMSDIEDDAFSSYNIGAKRPRSTASSVDTSAPPLKYKAGGTGIHRPIHKAMSTTSSRKTAKSRKSSTSIPNLKTGKEYKAKKAGGDMKRKGMPDPYAYLPLRRDALNKRKRMKAVGQMRNLLKKAQHGAKEGMKLNKKNKKGNR